MSKSSRQLKVFLCHSHGDKESVLEVYNKLVAEGWVDPWLDDKKLLPGQDWNFEIEKAVDEADLILVFLTKNSVSKEGYVQRELRIVLDLADYKPEGALFVIPVRLEECDPPRRLRPWQYADYFPASNLPVAYNKLIASLKMRADTLGILTTTAHTVKEKPAPTIDENKQNMLDYAIVTREGRYGIPTADQILTNRFYTVGYSYPRRQAKWALEIIDPDRLEVVRVDNFRPDLRVPKEFRTDQVDYEGSGFDRGLLVKSASQSERQIQTSETFLLSNISPMHPEFNQGIWKELASAVRYLDAKKDVLETYVICGPIFNPDQPIITISPKGSKGNTLPIPHAFFKSILTENNRGVLRMWSFLIPNESTKAPLGEFLVSTKKVERYSGILLWERLVGSEIEKEKSKVRPMWKM